MSNYLSNIETALFGELKLKLLADPDLRDLTDAQLKRIVKPKKFIEKFEHYLVLNDSVLRITDNWFGGYVKGESLEQDAKEIMDVSDYIELDTVLDELIPAPQDDKQIPAREKTIARLTNRFMTALGAAGVKVVSTYYRVADLQAVTDLDAKKLVFQRDGARGKLLLPFKVHDAADYACADTELHLAQLEEHFPDVRAVTDWLCANRFIVQGRQDTFLHIQAPSGWGKTSILMQAWKDLDYGHETTLENIKTAVNGSTGTESAINFVQAAVVFFDEANRFTPELKNIVRSIPITEKFKAKVEVPIYAKVMVSHEEPNFLAGGVLDIQVINRFNRISYKGKATSYKDFIAAHPGYKLADHVRALKWLIVSTMNKWVALYQKDRVECQEQAFKVMDKFRATFGLHNQAQDSEARPEVIGDLFLEYLAEQVDMPIFGQIRVRRSGNKRHLGCMYCSKNDFAALWREFVDSQSEDMKWTVRNAAKTTRDYVLKNVDGERINLTEKIDGMTKNLKVYIFRDDSHLTTVEEDHSVVTEHTEPASNVTEFRGKMKRPRLPDGVTLQ